MPVPVKGNESQSAYISRCVKHEINSGYEQKQALAICYSYWRKKGK